MANLYTTTLSFKASLVLTSSVDVPDRAQDISDMEKEVKRLHDEGYRFEGDKVYLSTTDSKGLGTSKCFVVGSNGRCIPYPER